MDLENFTFLVMGQLKTSRTEVLEEYLKKRVKSVGIIGVISPFASYNESNFKLYENGQKKIEFDLPNFRVGKIKWFRPLVWFSFLIYIFACFKTVIKLKRKFDFFIGIATFSSMLGVLLKRFSVVKKVIYYCLDYYPSNRKFGLLSIENLIFKKIDNWLVKKADIIWEISPRIKEGRIKYTGFNKFSYKSIIVPLGYTDGIQRDYSFEKRERWTIGFVGSLSENQGLQMVIKAMPELAKKFPEISVRIIGSGPYSEKLKELVKKCNVEKHFIFHSFIKDDEEVYDILSKCMLGFATWTGDGSDNSLYADPGKPKLYALLGLPIIITDAPYVSEQISKLGAGIKIEYKTDDFIKAVENIIKDKKSFMTYKLGLEKFKPYCLAEPIFNAAFTELKNNWL